MARTRTLAWLRAEVRARTDNTTDDVPDAELDRIINGSVANLYDMLATINGELFLEEALIPVVAGTAAYALPTAAYRVMGVDARAAGKYRTLPRFHHAERNQLQDGPGTIATTAYRLQKGRLRLRPTPGWSGTIRLWYIPAPPELSTDVTFDFQAGWEEWVVLDSGLKLARRNEDDPGPWLAAKKDIEGQIRQAAQDLDDGEPDRIRDVAMEHYGTTLEGAG